MLPEIQRKIATYPDDVRAHFSAVEALIYEVAESLDKSVEESVKWGEASYLVKGGTAIRIDWKTRSPESLCLFFNCKTLLIDTFREVLPDAFEYQGNRELRFPVHSPLPVEPLRICIAAAMCYQTRKHDPLLGL
ncbi:DUF1801 domain-containing protein [Enterovibrio norvegicus]|uniref:DUF1801 domain-containing protein n=1 Tax=Enterovibrio norvegicus TaxID=188144 RepID=UPI000C833028|nr:DUF1801 domain-containing protein [Enterovibrio norvegicus]PML76184.1 hypothetical protein BCT69_05945 [Enterovibrio norvegicus]PMN62046.1 hypothetical protein BCT27_11915 [Enterovibrio norvegicus]